MTDDYFRGSRQVPYAATQADILAARLAHELTCSLLRQTAGEYVIASEADADAGHATGMEGALALVRNNLARNPALQITANAGGANARLAGQAHSITGDLHQYWVTITPTGDVDLPPVSASAYVRLPESAPSRAVTGGAPSVSPRPATRLVADDLIAPLQVVEPRRRRACLAAGAARGRPKLVKADHQIQRGDCFLLQTQAHRDASIFLLNYQVTHGLVSLSGARCGPSSTPWRSVRAGQALRFPTRDDVRPSASAWQGRPGIESFYAIAVSDGNAARELSALVEALPVRCSLSAMQGLDGPDLQDWLGQLDWQAVRVEHRY